MFDEIAKSSQSPRFFIHLRTPFNTLYSVNCCISNFSLCRSKFAVLAIVCFLVQFSFIALVCAQTRAPIATISGGGLNNNFGVAVGSDGRVYVADTGSRRIVIYNSYTDTSSPVIISSGLDRPFSVAVDSVGRIYVAD